MKTRPRRNAEERPRRARTATLATLAVALFVAACPSRTGAPANPEPTASAEPPAPSSPPRSSAPSSAPVPSASSPVPQPSASPSAAQSSAPPPGSSVAPVPRVPPPAHIVVGPETCRSDADCVKDSCCHAQGCTSRAHAPVCQHVACTMECRGGTLDCGGSCLCQDGHCAARFPSF